MNEATTKISGGGTIPQCADGDQAKEGVQASTAQALADMAPLKRKGGGDDKKGKGDKRAKTPVKEEDEETKTEA